MCVFACVSVVFGPLDGVRPPKQYGELTARHASMRHSLFTRYEYMPNAAAIHVNRSISGSILANAISLWPTIILMLHYAVVHCNSNCEFRLFIMFVRKEFDGF